MISDKIMILNACSYNDLAKNSKVFNTSEIEYHLWIYMNPEDVREASFLEAYEVSPEIHDSDVHTSIFERESTCWIRAVTRSLNLNPGKHTYKLKMVNKFTDTDFSLYVSYYIQDDNPDKPYVYMNKEESDSEDSSEEELTLYEDPDMEDETQINSPSI